MDGAATASNFLAHVDAQRPWAATRIGLDLLEDEGPTALVDDLLVPVQQQVGCRWEDRTYSVAEEHLVTGLVDQLLGAASAVVGEPDPDAPRVTMVCAAGEWHASAARMTALRLRDLGWDVHSLGITVSPEELEGHLRQTSPDALLLSCTMAAALPGAAALAAAAHRVGIPVIAGGAAFRDAHDAGARLGADAVAGSTAEASEVLARWRAVGRPPVRVVVDPDPTGERASFAAARRELVAAVVEQTPGPFRPEDEAEVDGLLSTLDAALLLDDLDVLRRHMAWLAARERTRQVLPVPLEDVVALLTHTMPSALPRPRAFLTDAAAGLRAS